jgi:ssDNA thymidine ADP-ribosyltransferase, DarT
MQRPIPTHVVHFTRVEHVADIIEHGLLSDNEAQARGLMRIEVGNTSIKERRRRRLIAIPPGGAVADYVPFYYAPRSPMMYAIHCGNVPTYKDGCERIVYLVSSLERLAEHGLQVLMTDRNAVLEFAEVKDFARGVPEDFIDWDLMKTTYWNDTDQFPDRKERRMAECLAYPRVPWDAVEQIVTKSPAVRDELESGIAGAGDTPIIVRPQWYF